MGALQRTEVILDEALGRLGARPLAYTPEHHFALREQVMDLIEEHPKSLRIHIEEFIYNDGRSAKLLRATGTVPMFYREAKYNLPLSIWLPERFPLVAPIAYVTPTPDMIINSKNRNVDANGLISSDYLANWAYPGSKLRDFVGDLCIVFNDTPPLYKKTGTQQRQRQASPVSTTAPGGSGGFHATNPLAAGAMQPPQQQQPGPAFWQAAPSQQQAAPPAAATAASAAQAAAIRQQRESAYRTALATALAARLGASLEASQAAEREHQLAVQRELRGRAAGLAEDVAALQRERVEVEVAAGEYAAANIALGRWLVENEPKAEALRAAADGAIDPDKAVVAADPLSSQALHAQATDLALEDSMGALDRALEAGTLQVDAYLRQIRIISRQQFTARAVSNKIAARQAEARPARPPPAGAAPSGLGQPAEGTPALPPPAQLPIGDLWHSTGGILMNPLAAAANSMRR